MKKYLFLFILAGLVFSNSAFAEESDNGETGPLPPIYNPDLKEKRGFFKEKREERPGAFMMNKEKREEWKNKTEEERKTFFGELKSNRQKFLSELKAKREEWKNASKERKQEFCSKAREIAHSRFSMAVSSIEKMQGRVADIIEKLKEEGKNTSSALANLNSSKDKLSLAKAKVEEIKKLAPEGCSDVTPENFEKIKTLAREAKDLLKESREYLHQAIEELKSLRDEDDNEGDENN
jgi:methyl-accepting chemotaxis protein